MNKKAQAWIFWIIGFIVIIGIVVVLVISNQEKTIVYTESPVKIDLYLRVLQPNTEISLKGNYRITNFQNGYELSKGELLEKSYTLIEGIKENKTKIYCSADNHYSSIITKEFDYNEKTTNLSKVDCIVNLIGKPKIESYKNLIEGDNLITLNVSSAGMFNHPTMCVAWSSGIVSVNKQNPSLICYESIWLNYSEYNYQTLEYVLLPENTYRCGEWIEKCESVSGIMCNPMPFEEPIRLKNKVDKCFKLSGELKNSNMEVNLDIKTNSLNSLDKINVFLYDENLIYNEITLQYEYLSEYNEVNLGAEDLIYEIK